MHQAFCNYIFPKEIPIKEIPIEETPIGWCNIDPEFLSELIGLTINRVLDYKFGQPYPILLGSLRSGFMSNDPLRGPDGEIIKWKSLVFDKSVVNLHVISHDTADVGSEKHDSFWPEYTKSGYRVCNQDGITLRNLTEGVYRMQGLEYPWYCARYQGIEINHGSLESVVVTVKFHYVK